MAAARVPRTVWPRTVWPRIIPEVRTPAGQRVLLSAEIVATYLRCRREMTRADIREVVGAIRSRPRAYEPRWEPGSFEERLVAGRLGNAVTRTLSVLPSDSRCLVRSLVLLSVLSRRGISGTLIIGAHSCPDFAAHAWVEHRGRPLLSTERFEDARLTEI